MKKKIDKKIDEKILISSNLNILRTHHLWNKITTKHEVKILEMYENIFSFSSKNNNLELHSIYFFQTIDNKKFSINNLKQRLKPLIDRLKKTDKRTFFYYSFYKKQNFFSDQYENHDFKSEIVNFEKYLIQLSDKYKLFLPLNLDHEFCKIGYNYIFDNRNYYSSKNILSSKGLTELAQIIKRTIIKNKTKNAKLLILDLDNTLWGGVIGEDGIDKIQLGQDGVGEGFIDFQKKIKELNNKGLLLAVASKNNYKDAINVIDNHKSMILKKKDFVSIKINWDEKFKNIREISKDLSLGMDSFVFWDDNPIERDKIKKFCPEVNVINPPEDVSDWIDFFEDIDFIHKVKSTSEDKTKSNQYRIRAKFIDDLNNNKDNLNQLLSKLKIKSNFLNITSSNLDRSEQLCEKTNQFNLTTKRYNAKQIDNFSKSKNYLCNLVSVKDIYGDHGIIALYNVELRKKEATLDLFLMSCRILGRKIENSIIDHIVKELKKRNKVKLNAKFIQTSKNNLCKEFLPNYGFKFLKKNRNCYEYYLEI